jgi:hypothetical protein
VDRIDAVLGTNYSCLLKDNIQLNYHEVMLRLQSIPIGEPILH